MFSGDFESFEAAAAHAVGYDHAAPARAAAERLISLLEGRSPPEVDGRYMQVHSALCVARECLGPGSLSVLDIGGANGHYFFVLTSRLGMRDLRWHVVETNHMVSACQPLGAPQITFSTDIPDEAFDIVLLSGALQYLANPSEVLHRVRRIARWVIVTRLPVSRFGRSRFMVQTVPAEIHEGSMPIRIFDADEFESAASSVGRIALTWRVPADDGAFVGMGVENVGMLIKC